MRLRAALALAAAFVVSLAGNASGQGFQGGLRGAIKDAGGVVPGVEVTLNNEQTNINRSTVTNDRGEYVFSSVDPGTYTVRAALQGFKKIERAGIRIGTQTFIVLDLTLEVGTLSESVTVTGQSPLIETLPNASVHNGPESRRARNAKSNHVVRKPSIVDAILMAGAPA